MAHPRGGQPYHGPEDDLDQLAGNEMLANFLWAVGEDAMAAPGQHHATQQQQQRAAAVAQQHPQPALGPAMPRAEAPLPPGWDQAVRGVDAQRTDSMNTESEQEDVKFHDQGGRAQQYSPEPADRKDQPAAPSVPSASFNMGGLMPPGAGPFAHLSGLFPGLHGMAPGLGPGAAQNPLLLNSLGLGANPCAFPGLMPQLPLGVGGAASGDAAKNQQRLQKKAESARVARVRKKHYVATLELEVSELKAQVRALQNARAAAQGHGDGGAGANGGAGAGAGGSSGQGAQSAIDTKVQEMSDMLQRHSIDRLTSDVNNLVEQFVQNQRERQNSMNHHFNEILDLLDIGPQYKMAFWDALEARRQGVGAPASADQDQVMDQGTGNQLLDLLVDELRMTPAQVERLEECRKRCQELQQSLRYCHQLVHQAREQVVQNVRATQQVMDNMRGVLSPQQVARFLVWVEKHKRSMEVFNSITENGA